MMHGAKHCRSRNFLIFYVLNRYIGSAGYRSRPLVILNGVFRNSRCYMTHSNLLPGKRAFTALLAVCLVLFGDSPVFASDLIRTSGGAGSMGAGNIAQLGRGPLSAMANNPALLVGQESGLQVSTQTVSVDSTFITALNESAEADDGPGIIPEIAFARPLDEFITLGGAVSVRSALRAEFAFTDPPGTLGISYGEQAHESEYIVINAGLGLGYAVTERLSLGAALSLSWNRNRLKAPYIFQTHPVLEGLKVLVDMEVDDVTAGGVLGFNYAINDALDVSLSYALESDFRARGDLHGELGQLGLGIEPDFRYNARVDTGVPAFTSLGVRWRATDALTLGAQADLIHWEETFQELPLRLTNGNNARLNEFLGSTRIDDRAPLDWDDQTIWHLGGQYALTESTTLSLGIERSDVPVPTATMTPMTGAILNQAYSFGLSRNFGDTVLDLAYRFSDSDPVHVTDSVLDGGEYNNTALDLSLHTLAVTLKF